MDIRMLIKFHGSYSVTIRSGEKETRERCQKLNIKELSQEKEKEALSGQPEATASTHLITFYDFGCKRILEGKLKENEEERVVFQVDDKEYEFSPFRPPVR